MKGIYGRKRTVSFEVRDRGDGTGSAEGTGETEGTGSAEGTGETEGIEFIEPRFDPSETIQLGNEDRPTGSEASPETGSQKRGRRKGWRKEVDGKQTRKKVPTTLDGLETLLHTIHLSLSLMTHIPEFTITKEEADLQAKAYAKVASLYDFGATEEMLAWANLVTVLGAQYGTRYLAYSIRTKNEAAAKPKPFLVNQ